MSTHRLGEAEYLHLRLFLEGVEVPVVSATVDVNEGSAATAQVEIVGLDSALRILPRTLVHLFFFDGPAFNHDGKPNKKAENYYRLLFMGEVFSYTYQKTGQGSRAVILNCTDFSNYWDTSYLFQISGEQGFLDVPQTQPFITGSEVFAENIVTDNMGFLISTISAATQLDQTFKGKDTVSSEFLTKLFGFLELLGGVSVIDSSAKELTRESAFGGMSLWHTISERRVRLLDQVGVDSGETAAQLFEENKFIEFLQNQTDLSSPVLSFRDILNMLLGYIYYSHFPNPCGRLTSSEFTARPVLVGSGSSGGEVDKPDYVGDDRPGGSEDKDDLFYKAVLTKIGATVTAENMKFFYAWRKAEGAHALYNPFNTTQSAGYPTATRYNILKNEAGVDVGVGVRNYQSEDDGINATAATLRLRYYPELLASLQNPELTAKEIATASIDNLNVWNGKAGGDYVLRVVNEMGPKFTKKTIARKPDEEDTSPTSPTDTADPVDPYATSEGQ
jgi:hypothetical protein